MSYIQSSPQKYLQYQYGTEKLYQLRAYVDLLGEWRQYLNLIGRNEQIWQRHVADCAWWLPYLGTYVHASSSIVDLGSGAGFPGVVISILLEHTVTLIEARQKKCQFLREVQKIFSQEYTHQRFSSQNMHSLVEIRNCRIELVRDTYDVITARALAPLHQVLTLCQPLLKRDSCCFFQKGRKVEEELRVAQRYFSFVYEKIPSPLSGGGCLLIVRAIQKK